MNFISSLFTSASCGVCFALPAAIQTTTQNLPAIVQAATQKKLPTTEEAVKRLNKQLEQTRKTIVELTDIKDKCLMEAIARRTKNASDPGAINALKRVKTLTAEIDKRLRLCETLETRIEQLQDAAFSRAVSQNLAEAREYLGKSKMTRQTVEELTRLASELDLYAEKTDAVTNALATSTAIFDEHALEHELDAMVDAERAAENDLATLPVVQAPLQTIQRTPREAVYE